MAKKTINVNVLLQKWMQVYPTIYYAVLNDYTSRINEEAEFVFEGKPKNIDILVDNVTRIVKDQRWHWPGDRVPYETMVMVPHDRLWIGTIDAGPQWKNKRRVDEIIRQDKTLKGRVDKLSLRPGLAYHAGIGPDMYIDVQPHLVLAFDEEEDHVYWRMKYE